MELNPAGETNVQELLFEYDQLRKEILHNDLSALQILGATIVLVTAMLSVAFSQELQTATGKGFLFFVATVIALIGLFQSTDRQRSSFIIASYLHIFTEPRLQHVKWETRLLKFRNLSPHRAGFGIPGGHQVLIYTILTYVTFALGTFYTVLDYAREPYLIGAGLFISLVFITWIIARAWRSHTEFVLQYARTFDPIWTKIREEENQPSAPNQP